MESYLIQIFHCRCLKNNVIYQKIVFSLDDKLFSITRLCYVEEYKKDDKGRKIRRKLTG